MTKLLLFSIENAYALKMYKYQLPDGSWSYTDKKPLKVIDNLKVTQIKVKAKKRIYFIEKKLNNKVSCSVNNLFSGPIQVVILVIPN